MWANFICAYRKVKENYPIPQQNFVNYLLIAPYGTFLLSLPDKYMNYNADCNRRKYRSQFYAISKSNYKTNRYKSNIGD